jgi:hypothetical protein
MSIIGNFGRSVERCLETFSVEALAAQMKAEWVGEALAQAGRASKRIRKLPAQFVMWLVIAAGVFKENSIMNVLRKIGSPLGISSVWAPEEPPCSAAVTRARDRLGVKPLVLLHGKVSASLCGRFGPEMRYKGMLVVEFDGLTMKVDDSEENRDYFGKPGASRGEAAYPQMRAVLMGSVTHHFVLHGALAPFCVGEVPLAQGLLAYLEPGSLALLDRNFAAYKIMCDIMQRDSQFIIRLKKNMKTRRLKRLGAGDWLALLRPNRKLASQCPGLPPSIPVREIKYRVKGKRTIRLATSLTDHQQFPAGEIAVLYGMRWEAELMHDEIKTHQCKAATVNRPLICRSRKPMRVIQEALGLIIAYNLMRAAMAEGARHAGLPPLRISFIDSLERIREAVTRMAAAPGEALPWLNRALIEEIATLALPRRRARANPRAVKIKMSGYLLKKRKKPKRGAA